MEFQYASDLHINDFPATTPFSNFIIPSAPLLVIAGDICPVDLPIYSDFLRWCSRNWKQVIILAGNHEYYCTVIPRNIDRIDKEIEQICMGIPNVTFLQAGDSIVFQGFRFIGSTLWSAVDPKIWQKVYETKGDYKATYTDGRRTSPVDTSALHTFHKQRLRHVIASSAEPVIVLTHHMPSYDLVSPEYKHTENVSCYASHDDDLFSPKVRIWICGHAHRCGRMEKNGTLCLMNARGYESQVGTNGYSPTRTIQLRM
jgi:hypothetical protein